MTVKRNEAFWAVCDRKTGAVMVSKKGQALVFDTRRLARGACGYGERVEPMALFGDADARELEGKR